MSKVLNDLASLAESIKNTDNPELKAYVDDDLDTLENYYNRIPDYFESVINMQVGIEMARFRLEGDEYTERVQYLDKARRSRHEAMTVGINGINRMCDIYGHERVFELPEGKKELNFNSAEDRAYAARLCFDFCKDAYLDGQDRSIYTAKEESIADEREMDRELKNMADNHVQMKGKVSVDDLIEMAKKETVSAGSDAPDADEPER